MAAPTYKTGAGRKSKKTSSTSSATDVYEKFDLANRHDGSNVFRVSAAEIIQELPELSPAERRTVRRMLSDLAAKDEDVQLCNQVATEAARMFDRMEAEDDRHQQG